MVWFGEIGLLTGFPGICLWLATEKCVCVRLRVADEYLAVMAQRFAVSQYIVARFPAPSVGVCCQWFTETVRVSLYFPTTTFFVDLFYPVYI